MWVARDKNGELNLFIKKPNRESEDWWMWDNNDDGLINLDESLFPDLKWEDEPLEVKLVNNNILSELVIDVLKKTEISTDKQTEIFAFMLEHNFFID